MEDAWIAASRDFPVLLLTGPRQVGKTTLLRQLGKTERLYVTLDDMALRDLARRDPALFLQRFPPPVTIDEIQYAPELLPFIKMAADSRGRSGLFWLTGSQQFHLMKGVTESLAGRIAIVQLHGFSLREASGRPSALSPFLPDPNVLSERCRSAEDFDLRTAYAAISKGAFPAVATGRVSDADLFHRSYIQTYLERDVRDLLRVGDLETFRRFMKVTAARTGQLLNYSDLARDVGVSVNTARQWMSVLVAGGQVFLLPPYHANINRRLCKTPKLYFMDTGLAAYLTEWKTPGTLAAGAMAGCFFETAVVAEILKSWWHRLREPPVYFYRDSDGREVDLLLSQDGALYPVEIKRAASVSPADIPLQALKALKVPIAHGAIVCLASRPQPLTPELDIIPFGLL